MGSAAHAAGGPASVEDGRNDFDFFMGRWNVRHRRLKTLLAGSDAWYEFPGTSVARKILSGIGNIDENDFPTQGFGGMTLRLFDPAEGEGEEKIPFPPCGGRQGWG